MAGERIFMRTDLDTDPRVRRIAHTLQIEDIRLLIGMLWQFWSFADTHSEDGLIRFELPEILDARMRCSGFTDALALVEWLEVVEGGIRIPHFTEYNGKSAKKRLRQAQWAFEKRCKDGDVDAPGRHPVDIASTSRRQKVDIASTTGRPASESGTVTTQKKQPAATAGRPTWITPFAEAWTERFGGQMPVKPALVPLAEVRGMVGDAEALTRWRRYLDATEAAYANPARFASTIKAWTADASPPQRPAQTAAGRTMQSIEEAFRK